MLARSSSARVARSLEQNACSTSARAMVPAVPRVSRSAMASVASPCALGPRRPAARELVARGIPVSGPGAAPASSGGVEGQVSAELMASMRTKICEALETADCAVTDVYGDGRHVSINVTSAAFEGKNSMQRQRMVYKAIWLELQEAVHAVDSMTTKTPAEATQ